MKKKEFSKKLTLNKETVANLDNSKMKSVKGGYSTELIDPMESLVNNCPTVVGEAWCALRGAMREGFTL